MILFLVILFAAMINPAFAASSDSTLKSTVVAIPGGEKGVGFDDLVYSPELHKVLVPAGHTGKLYLIDPATFEMTNIGGFSSSPEFQKGHHTGTSSADVGEGYLFAMDHGKNALDAIDPKSGAMVATAPLAGDADFVRYVGGNHEIWVTEPDNKQIEIFRLLQGEHPQLKSALFIPLSDGPEGLVIDRVHWRAYTNLGPQAVSIDLGSHKVLATWPNECVRSRCDALDAQKGRLFVACGEGKAVVFDLNQNNKKISELATDPGPDVISYNTKLSHLYFSSSKNATLSVLGVSPDGQLSLLGTGQAAQRSHCVVGDEEDNIWVCDPPHGQLLRYKDTFPAVK
jgi:hypothetical protein